MLIKLFCHATFLLIIDLNIFISEEREVKKLEQKRKHIL